MNMSKNLVRVPMLISVKSSKEASMALKSGADFIDAKEPSGGALGKLPVNIIKEIIATLKVVNFSGVSGLMLGNSFFSFFIISNQSNFHIRTNRFAKQVLFFDKV